MASEATVLENEVSSVVLPTMAKRYASPMFYIDLIGWDTEGREASEEYKNYVKDCCSGFHPIIYPYTEEGKKTWIEVCTKNNRMDLVALAANRDPKLLKSLNEMEEPKELKVTVTTVSENPKETLGKVVEDIDIDKLFEHLTSGNTDELNKIVYDLVMSSINIAGTVIDAKDAEEIKSFFDEDCFSEVIEEIQKIPAEAIDGFKKMLQGIQLHIVEICKSDIPFEDIVKEVKTLLSSIDTDIEAGTDKVIDAEFREVPAEETKKESENKNPISFDALKSGCFIEKDGKLIDSRSDWEQTKEGVLHDFPAMKYFIDVMEKFSYTGNFKVIGPSIMQAELIDNFGVKRTPMIIDLANTYGPWKTVGWIDENNNLYPVRFTSPSLESVILGRPLNDKEVKEITDLYSGVNPIKLATVFNFTGLTKNFDDKAFTKLCGNLSSILPIIDEMNTTFNDGSTLKFGFTKCDSVSRFSLKDESGTVIITFGYGPKDSNPISVTVGGKKIK